jgi:hypothetical protein
VRRDGISSNSFTHGAYCRPEGKALVGDEGIRQSQFVRQLEGLFGLRLDGQRIDDRTKPIVRALRRLHEVKQRNLDLRHALDIGADERVVDEFDAAMLGDERGEALAIRREGIAQRLRVEDRDHLTHPQHVPRLERETRTLRERRIEEHVGIDRSALVLQEVQADHVVILLAQCRVMARINLDGIDGQAAVARTVVVAITTLPGPRIGQCTRSRASVQQPLDIPILELAPGFIREPLRRRIALPITPCSLVSLGGEELRFVGVVVDGGGRCVHTCPRVWWLKNLLFGAVSTHKETGLATVQGRARRPHADRASGSTERARTRAKPNPCAVAGLGYASKRDGPKGRFPPAG